MKKIEQEFLELIESHMIQFGLLPEHGSNVDEDIDNEETTSVAKGNNIKN